MSDAPRTPPPSHSDRLDLDKALRLRQALEADQDQLFGLLQDPDPDLTRALLKNPNLGEQHLLALLKRRDLPEQLIKTVQRLAPAAGSRRLKIALAGHPGTPASLLSSLMAELFLFELVTVMQLPGAGQDQKVAAERAILKRLPETELGNKITLAHRGSPALLEALLKEGEPRLVQAVLANPRLRESSVLAFLKSPAAGAETISAVGRHPVWGSRPNLRFAMLRNRKTPPIWFTLLLPKLSNSELKSLSVSAGLTREQSALLRQEAERRSGASTRSGGRPR